MAIQNISQNKDPEATGKYCIKTGEEKLYRLDADQLKSFYTLLKDLNSSEAFSASEEEEGDVEIEIERNITLKEDDPIPCTTYSLYSNESEIQMVSYEQIKKISDLLQAFLKQYGKEQILSLDEAIQMAPEMEKESELTIEVCEDNESGKRSSVPKTPVNITQRISNESDPTNVQIEYVLWANELSSDWLTAKEMKTFYKVLEQFIEENHL